MVGVNINGTKEIGMRGNGKKDLSRGKESNLSRKLKISILVNFTKGSLMDLDLLNIKMNPHI